MTATGSALPVGRLPKAQRDDGHRPSNPRGITATGSEGLTATGAAIVEVDSAVARVAIERDISSNADQWRQLQEVETEAAYGPVDPEPADIQELSREDAQSKRKRTSEYAYADAAVAARNDICGRMQRYGIALSSAGSPPATQDRAQQRRIAPCNAGSLPAQDVAHAPEGITQDRVQQRVVSKWAAAQRLYGSVESLLLAVAIGGPNDVMREIEELEDDEKEGRCEERCELSENPLAKFVKMVIIPQGEAATDGNAGAGSLQSNEKAQIVFRLLV